MERKDQGKVTSDYLNMRRRSMSEACTAMMSARGLTSPCASCSIRDICQRSYGDTAINAIADTDRTLAPIEFGLRLPRQASVDQRRHRVRKARAHTRVQRRPAA